MQQELKQDIVNYLKKSEVICMPTDTVLGLLCSALSADAVKKIYQLKGRSFNKPLSLLISDVEMADRYAFLNKRAKKLLMLADFSVTVILPRRLNCNMAKNINLKNQTIAMRIPKSASLQEIIKENDVALVATSANVSGLANLDKIFLKNLFRSAVKFFDVKLANSGQESAIVDCSGDKSKVVRANQAQEKILKKMLKC